MTAEERIDSAISEAILFNLMPPDKVFEIVQQAVDEATDQLAKDLKQSWNLAVKRAWPLK